MNPEEVFNTDLAQKKNAFADRLSDRGNFSYNKENTPVPQIDIVTPKKNIPTNPEEASMEEEYQPQKNRVEKTQFKELFKTEDKLPDQGMRNTLVDAKKEKGDKKTDIQKEAVEDTEGLDENGNPLAGMTKALDEDGNEVVVEQPVKPKFPSMIFGIAIIADTLGIILGFEGITSAFTALAEAATVVLALFAAAQLVMALAAFVFGWIINIMCIGILFTWFHRGDNKRLTKIGAKVAAKGVKKVGTLIKSAKLVSGGGEALPIINMIPFNSIFVIVAHHSNKKIFKLIIKAVEAFEFIEEKTK